MALQLELQYNPLGVVLEDTLAFLVRWLVLHILETDKRMAKTVLMMQQGIPLEDARQQGETCTEWLNLSAIQDETGEITNYVGVLSNVSQLIDRQKNLHHIANHDSLTGLPNRMLLRDRLTQEIQTNRREQDKVLAVLFIDLDEFKAVNDSFGHDAGDAVLVQAAQRFGQCVRAYDTVARLGGDEFVILLPHLSSIAEYKFTLERLLKSMDQPVLFDHKELSVSLSIGVSICPDHSDSVEKLLQLADKAMYAAKQAGKNRHALWSDISRARPCE